MQGVAGAEAEGVLVGEFGRCPEMAGCHRQNGEAFGHQFVEDGPRGRALFEGDLAGAQLDRHGSGQFRDGRIADRQVRRVLVHQPGLGPHGHRLVGQGGDDQRAVEIEHQ